MNYVLTLETKAGAERYRATLTGEILAWTIHPCADAFSPVHRVDDDPERGPVVVIGNRVFEVEESDDIYPTKATALEAYFNRPARVTERGQM